MFATVEIVLEIVSIEGNRRLPLTYSIHRKGYLMIRFPKNVDVALMQQSDGSKLLTMSPSIATLE